MLWEVSVVEVCEMVLEFSRENEVAAQNVCTHWLSSVSMLSKPPFVLKVFRRSHILCKNALHWCLISARRQRPYYQRTASLLLHKAKQEKFWKYWQHTQRRNVACFFFKLDFGSGLQISKSTSQHSWILICMPGSHSLCDLAELMICPAVDFMY